MTYENIISTEGCVIAAARQQIIERFTLKNRDTDKCPCPRNGQVRKSVFGLKLTDVGEQLVIGALHFAV